MITSYKVVSWSGSTTIVSAYTYSDAYEQASDFCGDAGIQSFDEC